MSLRIHTRGSH